MAWFLGRILLVGLALAGHVVSLPREDAVGREAQPDVQLYDRERILVERDDALFRRQRTITTDVAVQTLFSTLGVVGSSTTVVSSTASSVVTTTTAASSSAASTSAPASTSASAASSSPPSTTTSTVSGSQAAAPATASATAAPASSSGGGGLSGGAIAGIVIGVVAALAIAAGLGYFLARRRKSRRSGDANMPAFGQGQNQQPPPAMKETSAPYAGPSTGNGVYTSVTAGYEPAQQQVSHPTFSELPADSRPLQAPQPAYVQQSVPESPHGRSELETRE